MIAFAGDDEPSANSYSASAAAALSSAINRFFCKEPEFAECAGGGKNLMEIWERFVQSKALPLLDNDFLIVEDLRELASLPHDGKGGAPLALRIDSGARHPSVFLDP